MNGPELWAEWQQQSRRPLLRSDALKALDTSLGVYCGAPNATNLANARAAILAWKNAKAVGARTWLQTERRPAIEWLQRNIEGPLVPPIPGVWGLTQNCYAFAARDTAPGHPSAVPGATSNPVAPVTRLGGETQAQYHARLVAGVVSDAQAQARVVTPHAGVAIGAIPVPGMGHYVAAMVANAGGFHFLRRDAVGGVWVHKDGANAEPEGLVMHAGSGGELRLITDAVLQDAMQGNNGFHAAFGTMQFVAYFVFPDAGFHVDR